LFGFDDEGGDSGVVSERAGSGFYEEFLAFGLNGCVDFELSFDDLDGVFWRDVDGVGFALPCYVDLLLIARLLAYIPHYYCYLWRDYVL